MVAGWRGGSARVHDGALGLDQCTHEMGLERD